MTTPELLRNIHTLETQLRCFTKQNKHSINIKNILEYPNIYIIPPVITFVLLALTRPNFVYINVYVKGIKVQRFSFKHFIYSWVIISSLLCMILFLHKRYYVKK